MRTEDGHIIQKCLDGDSAAFGFLVDKYKASIYAFAYSRLNNFHDAEDVTQQVFIKAYEKLRTLKRWESFLAWLYSITSNLCKMHLRERSKQLDHESMENVDPDTLEILSLDSYRDRIARESAIDSLQESLDALPEIYSKVLILYYLGGMSNKEIARFLGTSSANIRQRLTRARSQLREEMIAMMSKTYTEQRLQASFTFQIVEAAKRIKIQPMPRMTGVPWGISLAAGIMFAVLSLSPHLSFFNSLAVPMNPPLVTETRVPKVGEIPVEILETAQISTITSMEAEGNDRNISSLSPQDAAPMAALGKADTWTTKSDMPTARYGLCCGIVNGKLYVIGGAEDLEISTIVEEYDPQTDKWVKKADMPTQRVFCSASVVDAKIYVMGGHETKDKIVSTVEEYDPATDKWTRKADMLSPNARFSASTVNGKIYAIGGFAGGVSARVEEYNPKTDTWTKKANMPTARGSISTCVVNNQIYAIGGALPDPIIPTVEEYDPVRDTWTKKADMPTPRVQHSTVAVNGYIYAVGGASDFSGETLSIVERYDPSTDVWVKKTDMPAPKAQFSIGAMDGYIYVFGGSPKFMAANMPAVPPLSDVEVYNTGFVPKSQGNAIDARGKFLASWGQIK